MITAEMLFDVNLGNVNRRIKELGLDDKLYFSQQEVADIFGIELGQLNTWPKFKAFRSYGSSRSRNDPWNVSQIAWYMTYGNKKVDALDYEVTKYLRKIDTNMEGMTESVERLRKCLLGEKEDNQD